MADIFDTADIVVCISCDAINRQFAELSRQSLIPNCFQFYRSTGADNKYNFTAVSQRAEIPPNAPSIVASIQTSIAIAQSGTNAILTIDFQPGSTANFLFPDDPTGSLITFDMNGWRFGVSVNLDLTSYGQGQLALPPSVDQELHHFSESMFDVRHLFLDLDSIDHTTADPALIKLTDTRPPVHAAFVSFMQFYLADLKRKGNPFVLGSTVLGSDRATLQVGNGQTGSIPDVLLPVGMTYSLFYDAAHPGRSCLCYAVATKGGHGAVSSPPNLMVNPIRNDQMDGVIAFSHAIFLEPLILQPMFENLRDSVYEQIRNTLSLQPGECLPAFPHVLSTQPWGSDAPPDEFPAIPWIVGGPAIPVIAGGPVIAGQGWRPAVVTPAISWTYPVAAANHDDDRYNNQYTVQVNPANAHTALLQFAGTMEIFKQHTTSFGFLGKAQAWANTEIKWSAEVAVIAVNSDNGVSIVLNSQSPPPQVTPSSGKNSGASFTDALAAIAGIAEGLTQSPHALFNAFNNLGQVSVSGIGMLGPAVNSLGTVVRTSFVMPAGSVFFADTPHIDPMGNYQLTLTTRR